MVATLARIVTDRLEPIGDQRLVTNRSVSRGEKQATILERWGSCCANNTTDSSKRSTTPKPDNFESRDTAGPGSYSEGVEEPVKFEKEALWLLVVNEVAGVVHHLDLGMWVR